MKKSTLAFCLTILSGSVLSQDTVLLRHQDTVITESAFRAAVVEWLPPQQRPAFYASPKRVIKLLNRLFVQYKLAEATQKLELTPDEQGRLDHAKQRTLSQIQINRIVRASEPANFDKEALEYFNANPDKYVMPEQVRVQHILVATESRTDAEAQERAAMVKSLAEKADKTFAELADEYSDDSSVTRNHGDLGYLVRGKTVESFEEAAFALQTPGDLTGPVKTQFGYHVIKFMARREPQPMTFEAVRDGIVQELKGKHRDKVVGEEFSRLAKIQGKDINEEAIHALIVRPEFLDQPAPKPTTDDQGAD